MNKFIKSGLVIAALLLCASTAMATSVTINATGITTHPPLSTPVAVGSYVQIISSEAATIGAPNSHGLPPSGAVVIATGTISPAGTFSAIRNIEAGRFVAIRVWESWNGVGDPPAGAYYGTSIAANVGTGFVMLGGYHPAAFSTGQQTAVPSAGTIQFSSATYSVGEAGPNVTITVTRTGGSVGAATVHYATSNGTATAGSDYTNTSGDLSWVAGNADSKNIIIPITDDTVVDPAETFTCALSGATGATPGAPASTTVTINDNDALPPTGTLQFSAATYSVNEAGPNVTITVTRTDGSAGAATVHYATSNGTATAGSDYTATSGDLSWAAGETASKTFTVAITNDTAVELAETANLTLSDATGAALGGTTSAVLTINDNDTDDDDDDGGPIISGVTGLPTNGGYIGETIVINGSGFGASKETSSVTVGGISTNPTAWSDTQIVCAIPSGVTAGSVPVVVTTTGGASAPSNITVQSGGIVLDDVEGGSVGSFQPGLVSSGYYSYGTGLIPDNANINANGPQAAAAHDGGKGMRVTYSYLSDWGGGWGATLANTLDASTYDRFNFFINWDGSANSFKLALNDDAGHSYTATVSNTTLANLSGYGKITIMKNQFAEDTSNASRTAGAIDWSRVKAYNFTYTTKSTSATPQRIDSITAGTVDLGGGDNGGTSGEVVITNIQPPAGPAGTMFKALGAGFGPTQGQSILVFENNVTGINYQVDILSWNDATIEAIAPRLAPIGDYTLKVVRMAISSGTMQAMESNSRGFSITSAMSAAGTATVYPNPFNPLSSNGAFNKANIVFVPGSATSIGVYIFDSTARLVSKTIVANVSQVTWDGRDQNGSHVADGLYLIRIVNEETKTVIAKGKVLVTKR